MFVEQDITLQDVSPDWACAAELDSEQRVTMKRPSYIKSAELNRDCACLQHHAQGQEHILIIVLFFERNFLEAVSFAACYKLVEIASDETRPVKLPAQRMTEFYLSRS